MKLILAFLLLALVLMIAVNEISGETSFYADLSKIHGLLRTADERLVQLSKKNCQTGEAYVQLCPFKDNTSYVETFKCMASSLLNGGESKTVVIYFDTVFATKPTVSILNSGFTWAFGTFFNITVQKVTPRALTVQVTAVYSPSVVHFNYIACDREILFPKAYLDIQEVIAFYNDS